jgi:hypothetical protein
VIALGKEKTDIQVRGIVKGTTATFEVDNGWCRKPAPCDGVLIETKTSTVLVPVAELERALREVRRARAHVREDDTP